MQRSELLQEYTRRLSGIVSSAFHERTILTVGVGAGSYAVEKLARLAPRELRNCDFDRVEIANLTRTSYTFDDGSTGRLKTEALEERIYRINPLVKVTSYPANLLDMTVAEISDMLDGVDLIIAGTDQFAAQALLNELAVERQIPAVWVGVHVQAKGGRVVWFVPGMPCYRCVAKERYRATPDRVNTNGMAGCILDCQLIDVIACKVAVCILERGQDSLMGRFYQQMGKRNDVIVSCHPDYEWGHTMLKAVLTNVPKPDANELMYGAFFSMSSLWLETERDPACPVCAFNLIHE